MREFYVGYLGLPPGHAAFLRVAVPLILWIMLLTAVGITTTARDAGDGVWDTGEQRTWTGALRTTPYPFLETREGALLIVGMGKVGVTERVASLDAHQVDLQGFLLERDGRRLIELAPGDEAIADLGVTGCPERPVVERGTVTLEGEIVDTKCFLGAMKPGDGTTHRACAALCIRGGIPPTLVVEGDDGARRYVLLVTADRRAANEVVLDRVAIPVRVTGALFSLGELEMLAIDSIE
ncbi:MAG: hypothetical protein KDA28_11345 [Phycisphaerales bacterium]|nr:hypothetical protein [Phycisphaerales bacterium]